VVFHPCQWRPGAGADAGCFDPVGDQITVGEDERDLDVNVVDRAVTSSPAARIPARPGGSPPVGQVVYEILTHQLVDDPVVGVVLELVLEPAHELRAVHPPSRAIAQQVY
jgi:hypothetical protein